MKKLSFKEYYESKEQLLKASSTVPNVSTSYILKKYCKLPVMFESDKNYIAFKPKDVISILWEYADPKTPQIKSFTFEDKVYELFWTSEKMQRWIESSAFEKS